MDDTTIPEFEKLPKNEQRELVRLFIRKLEKKKTLLMDGLLKCSANIDQTPANTLRASIASISNTIAALEQRTRTLADVRPFHIHVNVAPFVEGMNTEITLQLTQRKRSHPLPLNYYITIKAPMIPAISTPIQKKANTELRFTHTFDFGDRTAATINRLLEGRFKFRLMHVVRNGLQKENEVVALAVVSLAPLGTHIMTSLPIYLQRLDGQASNFQFDVELSVMSPLVPLEESVIDEVIHLIPDDI